MRTKRTLGHIRLASPWKPPRKHARSSCALCGSGVRCWYKLLRIWGSMCSLEAIDNVPDSISEHTTLHCDRRNCQNEYMSGEVNTSMWPTSRSRRAKTACTYMAACSLVIEKLALGDNANGTALFMCAVTGPTARPLDNFSTGHLIWQDENSLKIQACLLLHAVVHQCT